MNVEDRLRLFIVHEIAPGRVPTDVHTDYPLIAEHIIDSLGIFQVVGFMEAEFGIEVDDEDLLPEHFGSLAGMTRFVTTKRAGG